MPNDDKPEDKSDIPVLTLPTSGFQSRIPPNLLVGKSEDEQFIYSEISKTAAFAEFAANALVTLNGQLRHTNGKVSTLWALKELVTGWKALFLGVFALIGAIAGVVESWDFISSHWLHATTTVLPK